MITMPTLGYKSGVVPEAATPSKATGSISESIDNLIKKATEKREVTASIENGSLTSDVTAAGDKSLFAAGAKQLGKQDFLNLLVTQLKFQDPLSPTENTEFVAQLAQFSALEGTQNVSESMDNLSNNVQTMVDKQKESADIMSEASAVTLIGKRARMKVDEIQWEPSRKAPVKFMVHAPANKDALVALTNSKGEVINYVEMAGGGDKELLWSGSNMDGTQAPAGSYGLKIVGKNDVGTEIGYAYIEDRVTGVNYTDKGLTLQVGGQDVPFAQVAGLLDDVDQTESTTENETP